MSAIRIGIQGGKGSTNERACRFFAEKHGWNDIKIIYLVTTENVLRALHDGAVDYGTFAWRSSRKGLVAETQEALQHHTCKKIDEVVLPLNHALLGSTIDTRKTVHIFSHPQALAEHDTFLKDRFPLLKTHKEIDTALAAEKLSLHGYPKNSLVIAPLECAELYRLDIFLADLPENVGYETTLHLVTAY